MRTPIFLKGYDDRLDGIPRADNPYRSFAEEDQLAWESGWDEADAQLHGATGQPPSL
jgi:hypothetical protein